MRASNSSRFLILAALVLGFDLTPAQAQLPGGFSDFFVLGQDEHVWNMMNRVRSGEGAGAFPTPNRLNSVSAATATADGQRVTYDHWEDGLETDILAPVQTSTLVFGDSDNANGRVCDYSVDPRVFPCTGVPSHDDVLYAGTPMALSSDGGMAGTCAAPYVAPPSLAQVRCSFPISPAIASITQAAGTATVTVTDATGHSFANGATVRIAGANEAAYNGSFTITTAGPASLTFTYAVPPATPSPASGTITASFPTIRFDGGDRVFSTGGSLSIAQVQDPGTPLIGGGTELLGRELVKNATVYSVPVGEDLYPGTNNVYYSIKYAAINVVAFDDNTSVTVTSPGGTGGVRSFVLHRGQHYSSCTTFGPGVAGNGGTPGTCLSGAIDGPPPPSGPDNRGVFPALALTINAGTKIATDGPLNVLIFTGGSGAYQTRHYATLPDILHTTDYVTTAPGDDPATQGVSAMNLFIYNPNPTTSITVTATDTLGTTNIVVPPNSVSDYRNAVGRFVPPNSGVRLQSTRPFWGLSAYDSLALVRDWGHAWLGVRFLQSDYTISYAPGTQVTQIVSYSRTASPGCVATINTGTAHVISNGSTVRIAGVSDNQFNGTFTVTSVPTATSLTYVVPACVGGAIGVTASSGTLLGLCDNSAVPACNSYNRDPIWVAGTQNNTQVRIDFDADGLWDFIDTNSDNCPDNGDLAAPAGTCESNVLSVPPGCAALTANQCIYLVNGPGSASRNVLRVWDYNDLTNAGTRIVGSAPIALSWGQDTDQGQAGDPSPDNGYTVYPPIAIDLVLGIEKTVAPPRVPLAGGAANYTVRIFAGDYGPLTFVLPRDTLPPGITCANYQLGSTVITYPDLTTSTADPVCAVLPGGRSQLTWAPLNTTLLTSEQMLITYTVNIPAAPGGLPRSLENEAQVTGQLGSSTFNPKDTAIVTQADLTITKSVVDDGVPEVGDVLTYTVTVTNGNVSPETNVLLTDIVPPFTTYVPGSATISTSLVKTVTGITRAGTTATLTTTNPHGPLDLLTVSGAAQAAYNGTFVPVNLPLTGIAFAGPTATATTASAHGWANGDIIRIAGATDPLYNGNFTIAAVTATTFQYTMSGTPGAPSPAGPTATQVSPNKFSYTVAGAPATPATGTIIASGAGFDAGQNAVVWSGDTFAALAVATVTFQVRITDSTPSGSLIPNTANYSSAQIPSQNSNTVQTTVIGPILGLSKTITSVRTVSISSLSDGGTSTATATSTAHGFTVGQFVTIAGATAAPPNNYNGTFLVAAVPTANTFTYAESAASGSAAGGVITATTAVTPGSVLDYEVLLSNSGTGGAKAIGIIDNLVGTNTTYMAGTTTFSVNGGPFAALTDATDVDRFFFSGTTLSFSYFRPVTSITRAGATATVTTSVPHFFVNGNSVTIAGADDPAYNGTFVIAGAAGNTFTYPVVGTPATPATGVLTAELNPTFSLAPGGTIRLRFKARVNPGTVDLYATNQATAVATGQPITPSNLTQVPIVRPTVVSIAKTSSGAGIVQDGQTLTYTVVVSNDTGTTQTGIAINDPLPPGTTYVPGSASVTTSLPVIRSTEYYVAPGAFTLATFPLTLNQALAINYFVITQGSDLNGGVDSPPSRNYIALTGDPFGTGAGGAVAGLAVTGVANRIDFTRGAASLPGSSWSGVITVVECLNACTTTGFTLRDVGRIPHGAGAVGPTAVTPIDVAGRWTALGPIMLLGGFQGAGCDTADADVADAKTCHVRLFPSGTGAGSTINWTRDAGGATSLAAANSTVMIVEWGTEWTVNRQNITGGNGGAGINVAGEYDNSAAFAAVPRARTWVWGTGHTNNNEQRNASEGVALTLGNGVVQNANETILSAGIFNPQTKSFEVYALTHPSLVVDHRFKPQDTVADPATAIFDQTTILGSGARMALSTMGVDMNDNAYPQSMFSARYLSPAQIRLERRRTTGSFAAWTQGINFSSLNSTTAPVAPGHAPPGLVIPADGFTIQPGGSLTLTYQVLVDSPLSGAITQIANTATYTSTQVVAPGISSTVVDTVARPAVKVEPNNAGFVPFNAGTPQTILFTQGVTNKGTTTDSFTLTLDNDILGWKLELIDPATGVVIATDTNGDGVWDGGVTISTGPLAVNQTRLYTIRATVPAATPIGTQSSVELTATSALVPSVRDVGTDEITVLDVTKFGPVVLLPDHSGIVTAGQAIAYTHRIFNNTGSPEIFDLVVAGTGVGWTRTVHADTNGDGVYTPGIDLAIVNTANLPNGGSQILFVVVTAPGGATAGQNDFTDLTARSQTVPTQVDSVTDTTTILSATSHDLTGGGTRMVALGDTATYPGTLYNLTGTPDRFDIQIAATSLFGVDGLNHPTVLRVDTNADGISDTTIAIDANGDGTWDSLCGSGAPPLPCLPATFNFDGDAFPDVLVAGNGALNYELVRVIDPAQAIWKEYVTLSATSFSTGETDAVTAQWIIAALSRASIRGLRVDLSGAVEFVTGTQRGTKFFNLYETNERSRDGEKTLLNASPVLSPGPDSVVPILYRVETAPIRGRYLLIEETETSGTVLTYGPYSMTNTRLRRGLERVEAQMDAAEVPAGPVRLAHRNAARSSRAKAFRAERRTEARSASALARVARRSSSALRLDIEGAGVVRVPMTDLVNAGLPSWTPRSLSLTNLGRPVPFRIERRAHVSSLVFTATPLETDYSEVNPYVLAWGRTVLAPEVRLTRSSDPARPGYTRVERNSGYALAYVPDADPWAWDTLTGDGSTWPQGAWDPAAGEFDLPQLAAGARGAAPILIRLAGLTGDKHDVMARINGIDVGRVTFTGVRTALLSGSVPVSVLRRTGNELTLTYSALNSDGALAPSGYVLLDYIDIAAPMSGPTTDPASLAGIEAYSPTLPSLSRTQYLIVTHPLFKDQADRLASLKEDDGLRATVVTVDTAYDRFSGGVPEPQAIAALIRKAGEGRRLKYVLLFGDDTFDPRNFLGGDKTSFVPSIMGREGWGRIPNENAYADTNGDGRPDLAIGRLPVSTAEEAAAVVDKIAQQMSTLSASGNVHVFVNDDSREIDSKFDQEAVLMAQKLPASSTAVMADVGQGVGPARQTLLGSWGAGVTMTHYFGHGGPEIWTDEALFSVDDDLPGTMSPMVLFAWACQSQWYQNYFGPTINEALFLAPRSGSLASFGPVGTTSPAHQREIYERVYQDLYAEGVSLGEIIRRAKTAALIANPGNQDAVDGFMLFGDPSLRIPRP